MYYLTSNQKQGLISNGHKVVMPIPRLNPLPFELNNLQIEI